MADVPVEKLVVPRYAERPSKQEDSLDVKAWVVHSKSKPYRSYRLWMKPELHEELHPIYPSLPDIAEITRTGGFLNGRPMLDKGITIETCAGERRPEILYRVTHDAQPYGGIMSRGHEVNRADPLLFQVQVQKHINWNCYDPSPFLSVTDKLSKVTTIAAVCQARGYSGIEIVTFKSTGAGWDHKKQRLWPVHELLLAFDTMILFNRFCLPWEEFLLEESIPQDAIIKRETWAEKQNTLDPDGYLVQKMFRRVLSEQQREEKRRNRKREAEEEEALLAKMAEDRVAKMSEGQLAEMANGIITSHDDNHDEPKPKKRRATEFTLRM
ncbi:hypothetical protein F4779DRAFT_636949 [Xylariaceae sp. FL0662B]|nr:hypothetical protein F4779DRAFT_636949 [Xylariaceae sp. FL0662B]